MAWTPREIERASWNFINSMFWMMLVAFAVTLALVIFAHGDAFTAEVFGIVWAVTAAAKFAPVRS